MSVVWLIEASRSLLAFPHSWREAADPPLLTTIAITALMAHSMSRGVTGPRSQDAVPIAVHRRLQLSFVLVATGLLVTMFAFGLSSGH